jgi:hypothetical protein
MGFGAAAGAPAAGLLAAVGGFATLCLAAAGVGAGVAVLTRIRSRSAAVSGAVAAGRR